MLAVVNSTPMNFGVYISFRMIVFIFSRYMPKRVDLLGHPVLAVLVF